MKRISLSRGAEWAVLLMIVLAIFWRGGKGFEMTLLMSLIAAMATLVYSLRRILRIRHRLPDAGAPGMPRKNFDIPFLLWGILFLFLLLSIASWLFSETRNYGFDEILRDTALALLFFWTVRAGLSGTQEKFFDRFLRCMAFSSIGAAIVGVFVYVLQPVSRFVGTFFYVFSHADYWPNAWAEFLLLSWPFVLIVYARDENVRTKKFLLSGLCLLFAALLLSYSRGAAIVFLVQLVLCAGFFLFVALTDVRYRRLLRALRTRILLHVVLITAASLLFFGVINLARSGLYPVQSVHEKVTFTASEGTSSIDERIQFWKQAFSLSLDHPLLGYGPYSFRFVQPRVAQGVLETSDHPHNVILKLAMERGWAAVLLWLLFVLLIVGGSMTALLTKRREWSQERDITTMLMLVSVVGVVLHNLIDYNLQFVAIALPLWLSLGFLVIPGSSQESIVTSFAKWKRTQYLFWFKVCISALLLGVVVHQSWSLGWTAPGRLAGKSSAPARAFAQYQYADRLLLDKDLLLKEADWQMQRGKLAEAQQLLGRYQTQNQHDYRFWKAQGVLSARQGDFSAATKSFENAFTMAKYIDLEVLHLLLSSQREQDDRQKIASGKLQYDAVFSAFADAITRNTHFSALSQSPEHLMAAARDLGKLFPGDAKRYTVIARKAYTSAMGTRQKAESLGRGLLWQW